MLPLLIFLQYATLITAQQGNRKYIGKISEHAVFVGEKMARFYSLFYTICTVIFLLRTIKDKWIIAQPEKKPSIICQPKNNTGIR